MSGKAEKETAREEAATSEPKSFADLCKSMMTAKQDEGCGSRMQEMMPRCMANFTGEQKGQEESEKKEAKI